MVLERKAFLSMFPKKGNVMRVTYQNTNPDVVQPILRQVIDTYFKKHIEIHRNLGVLDEVFISKDRSTSVTAFRNGGGTSEIEVQSGSHLFG